MNEHVSKAKIARSMYTRPGGATMREIIAATGGPHYNELKRLAAQGCVVRKVKEGNETRYFVSAPAAPLLEATVTDKGQVTIPVEVRNRLRLRAGHKIRFAIEDGSRAVITPVETKLSDLAGLLGKPKRSVTLEEMDEAIRQGAVDRYLRAVGKKR
jgi:AbrB family looped-hinge helix DNA binding protein